jgi:hypothetical protein
MRARRSAPALPHEEFAAQLPFAKQKYRREPDEMIDTRDLPLRKIHPERDAEFLRWLKPQPCVRRFGIDRHALAAEYRARFLAEKERRS